MESLKVKYVNPFVCACHYYFLKEQIPLGIEYTIFPDTVKHGWSLICGGCGRVTENISVVLANSVLSPDSPPKYIPTMIFDMLSKDIRPPLKDCDGLGYKN